MQDCKDKNNKAKEYLYKYPFWKNLIRMKEDDIINASGDSDEGMPRGTDMTSLTESKALQLIDDEELQEIKIRVRRVEICIDYLKNTNKIYSKIVRLKYFESNLTDKEIYTKINISSATFYRYNEIILSELSKLIQMRVN